MSQDFAAACQVYYDRVYRFLLALSGDPNQAEDLTQEVFYRALLHIGSYREQGQMLTCCAPSGRTSGLASAARSAAELPPSPTRLSPDRRRPSPLRRSKIPCAGRWPPCRRTTGM